MNKNMRILIVDDMMALRKIIRKFLEQLGFHNFMEASNGIEALNKIEESLKNNSTYDMIFSDWSMPGLTGAELIEKIRSHGDSRVSKVKFIMVTAEVDTDSMQYAISKGVNDYLPKPFNIQNLETTIRKVWL